MKFDIEYVIPTIMAILMGLFFIGLVYVGFTIDDDEIELCEENGMEFLGGMRDESGSYYEYCGELKNGMLVKKYKIINSKYLEEE